MVRHPAPSWAGRSHPALPPPAVSVQEATRLLRGGGAAREAFAHAAHFSNVKCAAHMLVQHMPTCICTKSHAQTSQGTWCTWCRTCLPVPGGARHARAVANVTFEMCREWRTVSEHMNILATRNCSCYCALQCALQHAPHAVPTPCGARQSWPQDI